MTIFFACASCRFDYFYGQMEALEADIFPWSRIYRKRVAPRARVQPPSHKHGDSGKVGEKHCRLVVCWEGFACRRTRLSSDTKVMR